MLLKRFPVIRYQFFNAVGRMRRQTRKHIGKISVGINAIEFAGFDQTVKYRCALAALIAADKKIIFPFMLS